MAESAPKSSELPWTAADQMAVDTFEKTVLAAAEVWAGHADTIPIALIQVLGSLMGKNLQADPTRLPRYQHALETLCTYVQGSVLPERVRH